MWNFLKKWWWIIAVLAGLIAWGVGIVNTIKNYDIGVDGALANVQVQYQRRADLIPNLVKTVQAVADQEQTVFTEVTELRTKASSINVSVDDLESIGEFAAAQAELSQGLGRLLAVAEWYPDLKSNENFLDLQKQLEGTENRIAVAINNFNGAVGAYEKYRMNIPEKFVIERFTEYGTRNDAFFQADADAQDVPDVDFDI